jgi:hypothetical protein
MSTLADRIVANTRDTLEGFDLRVTPEWLETIRGIAAVVEAMVEGKAAKKLYLASAPTGGAKTRTMIEAIKIIVRDPAYRHIGILVLTNTLEQIEVLIKELGLEREQFAVRSGHKNVDLNEMGSPEHWKAQVMFTTQAKMKAIAEHQPSYRNNAFYTYAHCVGSHLDEDGAVVWEYEGNTRQVVFWDEAFIPIDPIVVTTAEIDQVAGRLSYIGQTAAAEAIREWIAKMDKMTPAFDTFANWLLKVQWHGNTAGDLIEEIAGDDKRAQELTESVFWLSGKTVKVECENYRKHGKLATVSYRQSVPHDIEPFLVFDADANEAMNYTLQRKWRNVEFLPRLRKSYSNLAIRYWDRASGQHTYRRRAEIEALAEAVAQAVGDKPTGEEVLIVHRKGDKAPSTTLRHVIVEKVKARGDDPRRLRFLTWGMHKATNDYKRVKHIVLVGLLQAPLSVIKGLVHGLSHTAMNTPLSIGEVEEARMSQIRTDLLQAVGRGATRNMVNGDVPIGCTLDVIASSNGPMGFSDPMRVLREMFPGAKIEAWHPKSAPCSTDAAVAAARTVLGVKPEAMTTMKELAFLSGYAERTLKGWHGNGRLAARLAAEGLSIEVINGVGVKVGKSL